MLAPYHEINDSNQLLIDGVSPIDIVMEYGTPVYVVSKRNLETMLNEIRKWDPSSYCSFQVAFAYKACPIPAVTRILSTLGAGAEVSSGLEMDLALKSGVPPEKIVFNGPYKSREEIKQSLELGIGVLNTESEEELRIITQMEFKGSTKFGVRIAIGNYSEGRTTSSRFGFPIEELRYILKKYPNIKITGIHCHAGTNIVKAGTYKHAYEQIKRAIDALRDIPNFSPNFIDIGGGFSPPISTIRNELENYDLLRNDMTYAEVIAEGLRGIINCNNNAGDLEYHIIEPGRYLVATAVCLLTIVTDIRYGDIDQTVIVDAGQRLISTNFTNVVHDIVNASNARVDTCTIPTNIYGPLCYEADIIAKGLPLPPIKHGDILAVFDCGAYDIPLASAFIRPLPPIVLVDSGHVSLVRRRQQFSDVFHLDLESGE